MPPCKFFRSHCCPRSTMCHKAHCTEWPIAEENWSQWACSRAEQLLLPVSEPPKEVRLAFLVCPKASILLQLNMVVAHLNLGKGNKHWDFVFFFSRIKMFPVLPVLHPLFWR